MKNSSEDLLIFYEKILVGLSEEKKEQASSFLKVYSEFFNFSTIECIETGASQNTKDGCFGLLLAKMCQSTGGVFSSVDLDPDISKKSVALYNSFFSEIQINSHVGDSVEFLKNYGGSPNLIHLDSWDLDLKNPVPSMLHGWLEFDAIRKKMPSGSICLIDDNFLKGTFTWWNLINPEGNILHSEEIETTYDIVGKGALVYHWAKKEETDWDLIGDHYYAGKNIKVIVKKR
jgi:hypothetical protein